MKVAVYDYRGYDDKPQIINDVEFDDALRMIHPDAAWMWDRDECTLNGGSAATVTVGLWPSQQGVVCVVNEGVINRSSITAFDGQRWKQNK